jgi:hypothetical protein
VFEEVLVVEKRLLLKEEIRVTRNRRESRTPQRFTLQEEEALVEPLVAPQGPEAPGGQH